MITTYYLLLTTQWRKQKITFWCRTWKSKTLSTRSRNQSQHFSPTLVKIRKKKKSKKYDITYFDAFFFKIRRRKRSKENLNHSKKLHLFQNKKKKMKKDRRCYKHFDLWFRQKYNYLNNDNGYNCYCNNKKNSCIFCMS